MSTNVVMTTMYTLAATFKEKHKRVNLCSTY